MVCPVQFVICSFLQQECFTVSYRHILNATILDAFSPPIPAVMDMDTVSKRRIYL